MKRYDRISQIEGADSLRIMKPMMFTASKRPGVALTGVVVRFGWWWKASTSDLLRNDTISPGRTVSRAGSLLRSKSRHGWRGDRNSRLPQIPRSLDRQGKETHKGESAGFFSQKDSI
jgi:hypothetical protein